MQHCRPDVPPKGTKTTLGGERECWTQCEFAIPLCPCLQGDKKKHCLVGEIRQWRENGSAAWQLCGALHPRTSSRNLSVKIPVLTQVSGTWTELWVATWKPWPCFQVLCACCWCFLCVAVSCAFCIVWESAAHWCPPCEFCVSFLQLGRTGEDKCLSSACALPGAKLSTKSLLLKSILPAVRGFRMCGWANLEATPEPNTGLILPFDTT